MAEPVAVQPVASATASQTKDVQDNQTNAQLGVIADGLAAQSAAGVAGLQAILAAIQAKPSA